MSYTFRVIFEGVCGYVPDKPFFTPYQVSSGKFYWRKNPQAVRSIAVLLPDLRRPAKPKPEKSHVNLPKFREPHFPLLKFRVGDLREGTTRRIDLVSRDISRQDEEGVLFLRREQIRFYMDAENQSDFSYAGWSPHPKDKEILLKNYKWYKDLPAWWGLEPDLWSREQLESLWWLPALDQIVPHIPAAHQAKPDVLPSYRGPFPEGLIARVECNGGRMRTFDFNRGVDGNPLRWRFAAPVPPKREEALKEWEKGSWNRALSNSLALEFFDVRGEITIELKRLANEVVSEKLVLAPAPGASRPLLEISISNREPDLLFQEEGFSYLTLPDMDFQPLYEQLSMADEKSIGDLPVPNPPPDMFFGIREKPCAGGALTP